ncbi:hypothetical protein IAR55_001441 [Kwoniella newhampshirensis]|uniref:Phosphogluconate dehydrogenase NAD-binding putative C-terminal domain-containing protein n=1 Tax=Kwoniella newhampshirensis TaxID=1651941 RepID=A0AAW0Z297_9TREE
MAITTISFLYPGAMGSSLARVLHQRQPHLTLLTSLTGRSQKTIDRATSCGLQNVPLPDLVSRSDLIISILPPSAATTLAKQIVSVLPTVTRVSSDPPIYLDANAISPDTVAAISKIVQEHGIPFIDGGVFGLPATEDGSSIPKLYLSAAPETEDKMKEVAEVLTGGGEGKGLKVPTLEGAGVGGASALKMCFGGINKGLIGLASVAVLAAQAHSPGTAKALMELLAQAKPDLLQGFTKSFPDSVNKAYRWVGEMEEVSAFITASLLPTAPKDGPSPADTYKGLAQVFQRVADSYDASESGREGGEDVTTLLDWAEESKKILDAKKGS